MLVKTSDCRIALLQPEPRRPRSALLNSWNGTVEEIHPSALPIEGRRR
jgi:hypothetical protein